MKHVQDLGHLGGQVVLVRVGVNVPISNQGEVLDDFRIQRILPTITYLQKQGAKVLLVGHIGRDVDCSLRSVAQYMTQHIPLQFKENFFVDDQYTENVQKLKQELSQLPDGSIFLLDNVRQGTAEKNNDKEAARILADIVDVYVNEAFSVSHRKHMSMHALPQLCATAVMGFACAQEVAALSPALHPSKSSIAIIAGNKITTKLPLINVLLEKYTTVVVGGALANSLYAAAGYEIGRSLHDPESERNYQTQLQDILQHPNIYIPSVVAVADQSGQSRIEHVSGITPIDAVYDVAPESLWELQERIQECDMLVWNGPLGWYEGGYVQGTHFMLEQITASHINTIVGGGNTVDTVRDLGFESKIDFLSTGGGAMLTFLQQGSLPGLDVLDA